MNIRRNTAVPGLALAAALTLGAAGCNRQEVPPPAAATPAPATTSVGTAIDDAVLTTRVKSALLGDADIKGFDIKVESRKGMVQLSGFVDSQAQVERAIAVARAVDGATGVDNGMRLKEGKVSVGNAVDDGVLTARVKSALLSEPSIKSFDIAVVTRKGEVQLSGFVDSQAQIDRAIGIATAIEGTQRVVSEMSIKR